jgi:hypothetical protein
MVRVSVDRTENEEKPMPKHFLYALPLILVAGSFGVPAAQAAVDLRCDASGQGDISMQARFERRDDGRRKFSTEFEAAPGGAFSAGQRMIVLVSGVRVGTDKLRTAVGGDIKGDLNLDDAAGPNDNEKPFPADFPDVTRNTQVVVKINGNKVLGCRLQ